MTMEPWKKNLAICCLASFIVSIGMSQMAPILPLYIRELGISAPNEIARWSGIVFGANFISLAIFSPIWGRLSDRYGRKPMVLRASYALGLVMICLGLAQSVYQLAILRLIQGTMTGFQAAVIPLIAQETPKDKSGWAMSMFFTFQVTGGLMGPVFGGWLSEIIGYRHSFFFIGTCCLLGCLALTRLHETKRPQIKVSDTNDTSLTGMLRKLPHPNAVIGLFLTTLLLHFSLTCIMPILTVYVHFLDPTNEHIAVVAGVIFSSAGFASMLFASKLGHLSDTRGPQVVLFGCLLLAGIVSVPQGIVTSPWQLAVLRFIHGIAMAGLIPSVNALIRVLTPSECLGRVYGFNQSFQFIGMFTGAFIGGSLVAAIGIRNMFFLTAVLLLINAAWFRVTIRRQMRD